VTGLFKLDDLTILGDAELISHSLPRQIESCRERIGIAEASRR
jgi:hypothetical protein